MPSFLFQDASIKFASWVTSNVGDCEGLCNYYTNVCQVLAWSRNGDTCFLQTTGATNKVIPGCTPTGAFDSYLKLSTLPKVGGITTFWCTDRGGTITSDGCKLSTKPYYRQAFLPIVSNGQLITQADAIEAGWTIVNNRAVRIVEFAGSWFEAMRDASLTWGGELAFPASDADQAAMFSALSSKVPQSALAYVWLGVDNYPFEVRICEPVLCYSSNHSPEWTSVDQIKTHDFRSSTSYGGNAQTAPPLSWASNQPDNLAGLEECLELGTTGGANDFRCFDSGTAYIVERRLASPETTTTLTTTTTTQSTTSESISTTSTTSAPPPSATDTYISLGAIDVASTLGSILSSYVNPSDPQCRLMCNAQSSCVGYIVRPDDYPSNKVIPGRYPSGEVDVYVKRAALPTVGGVTSYWCTSRGGNIANNACELWEQPYFRQARLGIVQDGQFITTADAIAGSWTIVNNRAVRIVPSTASWFEAMGEASVTWGGELAFPASGVDQLDLANALLPTVPAGALPYVWVGADGYETNPVFRSSTSYGGNSLPTTPFVWATNPQQPDNAVGWEACMNLDGTQSGAANDFRCFDPGTAYIVERRIVPTITTTESTTSATPVTTTTTTTTPTPIPGSGGVTAYWCVSRGGTVINGVTCSINTIYGNEVSIISDGQYITPEAADADGWTIVNGRAVRLVTTTELNWFEAMKDASQSWGVS
ncbi:hypothetical protein HDU93_009170 [Gonapodya sp. JEL0774]|nr:hypothetical protein HDU93_009170 [Gonapodya sp. JEL0774]